MAKYVKLTDSKSKSEVVYPMTDYTMVKDLGKFKGFQRKVEVLVHFLTETKLYGKLSAEQLAVLKNYTNVMLVLSANYKGTMTYIAFTTYSNQGNYRQYAFKTDEMYITNIVNMETGEIDATLYPSDIEKELIISNSGKPTEEKDLASLCEDTDNGILYQMVNKKAGLFKADGSMIVAWEDTGIDDYCSNAGSIISSLYPDTRIVKVGSNVKYVYRDSFEGADFITQLHLPDSIKGIEPDALAGLVGLEYVNLPFSGIAQKSNKENGLFGIVFSSIPRDGTTECKQWANNVNYIICYIPSNLKTIIIRKPSTANALRQFNGITTIENAYILNCSWLGNYAFDGCTALKNVYLYPKGALVMGEQAFKGTAIENIVLADGIRSIGNAFENATNLKTITFKGGVPPSHTALPSSLTNIYCPTESLEAFQEDYAEVLSIISADSGKYVLPAFIDPLKKWAEVPYAQRMFDLCHPIGETYVQYKGYNDPNTLYNNDEIYCEWEDITEKVDGRYPVFSKENESGTELAEELPNIKGDIEPIATDKESGGVETMTHTGCYDNIEKANYNGATGNDSLRIVIHFDASKSNAVYKDDGKVQPLSTTTKLWIRRK